MAGARLTSWTSPIRLFGVQIRIDASWVAIALLIAWSLATGSLPMFYAGLPREAYWLMAVIIVIGLAISVVLHELAHTLVGRAVGIKVERITLFMFGGAAELHAEPTAATAELVMALAGPLFSVVFAVLLGVASAALQPAGAPQAVVNALAYLATLNLVLAGFNMIPAFPLDGGRVLRAVIWMVTRNADRATQIAARLGEAVAFGLMALGLVAALTGGLVGGIWWILIGLFIQMSARAARHDLEARRLFAGRPIGQLMVRPVESAPAEMSLDDFVEQHLLVTHHSLYPVLAGGEWKGVVEPGQVLGVPRERWKTVTLGEVCTPRAQAPVTAPDADAAEVLDQMLRRDATRLLVVNRGAVEGVVTLHDLQARLALERALHPSAA